MSFVLSTAGVLWLLLPAAMANMAPVFASKIFGPGRPIDGGRKIGGTRLFGDHKTWQGLIAGIVVGQLTFGIQWLMAGLSWVSVIQLGTGLPVFLGALMGFGALAGDLVKSFFKRKIGVAPGKSWIPFDQIDFVIGATLVSLPFVMSPLLPWLAALMILLVLHILTNVIGWLIGIKKSVL